MEEGDQPVLIYSTFPSLDEAKRIGAALTNARLAACVNILPGMISIYEWEGSQETAEEAAMIIKTRGRLAQQVMAEVTRLHSYDVPALLVLPAMGGSVEYCSWIVQQTQQDGRGGGA
ncbi:MAG: divalent-cation tolerance protein CutA [Pseudomonadota bacterium]